MLRRSIYVILMTALAANTATAASKFKYENLGNLGIGFQTDASAINKIAQIAASSETLRGVSSALLTGPKGVGAQKLGNLGGNITNATGLNDGGRVVGYATLSDQNTQHAFLSAPNGFELADLGTLGGNYSAAYAINNQNVIVGASKMVDSNYFLPFMIDGLGAPMRAIPMIVGGTSGQARGVNSQGQAVGQVYFFGTQGSHTDPFVTEPQGGAMTDLGTWGGIDGMAFAINDLGQIVGYATDSGGHERAFVTDPHSIEKIAVNDPDGRDTVLVSINSSGVSVGHDLGPNKKDRAVILQAGKTNLQLLSNLVSLPTGITITDAISINDAGKILCIDSKGNICLLTPK